MVAAKETTLQELLEGAKQYRVPLYQRTYSWQDDQLKRLWDDVVQLAVDRLAEPAATHFIGSVVLAPSPSNGPTGVQEYLVVDGQQRLTTLTLLLCALRDHRVRTESAEHRARIDEQYLVNRWKPEAQRIKVAPTQADLPAYVAVIDAAEPPEGAVGHAYSFFASRIIGAAGPSSGDADDGEPAASIDDLESAVLGGLALVSVVAQAGDNAHRIFESLNNTGLKLTQGDLLRNYLFMRMPTVGEAVYNSRWMPLQALLSSDELELLFWLDLVHSDPRIKQGDTYAGQQRRLERLRTESEIEAEVARFGRLGRLLDLILRPAGEADSDVRFRLQRLAAWGTTTVYPLALRLLDLRDRGTATSTQVAAALLFVESFIVRRLLGGRSTTGLNRILLGTVAEMAEDQPVDVAVHTYLSSGRKHYATDDDVLTACQTVPFYLNGRPNQRSLILRWLEESYASKEPVQPVGLTIEHVLPQTMTPAWEAELANDEEPVDQVHARLVHTLGNLTLTGYNSTLSNNPFSAKRTELANSGVRMNQEIAAHERWGAAEIEDRAAALAARVNSIWPGPRQGLAASGGLDWSLVHRAVTALPAGAWTTYGALAALIGSHPVPVGNHLAAVALPHAYRVLRSDGSLSADFRWLEADRDDDPLALLQAEGVHFDDSGRASPAQRLDAAELAVLVGAAPDDLPAMVPTPPDGGRSAERDQFLSQVGQAQSPSVMHGLLALLDAWVGLGGRLEYGLSAETSCMLMATDATDLADKLWPVAIYPSGKVEVVFQYLATRSPFDDWGHREELRRRLNELPGIDLPSAKLQFRPGFDLGLLADRSTREALEGHLRWFLELARGASAPPPVFSE